MIWRNEKIFFKRKCDATGKEVFSMFPSAAPVKVYDRDYWWSDEWDAVEYGRAYDFTRPFFEQLKELIQSVPWPSKSFLYNVKSDYCMNCSGLKNCYFLFDADYSEDSSYGVAIKQSKTCFDNFLIDACELCYDCFFCTRCYKTLYSENCEDCQDTFFSRDCINCMQCFGCVGLRNKSYCIFNTQYSKEEYFEKLKEFSPGSYASVIENKKKAHDFFLKFPVKYMHGSNNINVSGDYIYHCKNVHDSYMVRESEDSRYCYTLKLSPGARNCYDYDLFAWNAERIYECNNVGYNAANILFSALVYLNVSDIEYSLSCNSANNLFGCVGMQKKQYCILNKQYTKEEYVRFLPQIKEHMNALPYRDAQGREYPYGEFIPAELCPYAYNESLVQEYMPLSRAQAKKNGFLWRAPVLKEYATTMSWKNLPDHSNDVPGAITKETILCQEWDENSERAQEHNCTKAFRITEAELEFYRKMLLPLPRKCFYCRHYARTQERTPVLKKYRRGCACGSTAYKNIVAHVHGARPCQNEFETSYALDRPEIVYCETCYQAEIL